MIKYQTFFQSRFFLFFELRLKSVSGSPWVHYFSYLLHILCPTLVSDEESLCETGTLLLLLDLSVLFLWDDLLLKDLGNLLPPKEINRTNLNLLKPCERSCVVHMCSLLCSFYFLWQIELKDMEEVEVCEGEILCLSVGVNSSMLRICISFTQYFIVISTTEILLNSSNVLMLWEECLDDFRSRSDVASVAKLLLICGMKKCFYVESHFDCITYYH